jgi:hypothetical protein
VVVEERRDVVDLGTDSHIAGLFGVVGGDLSRGQGWECPAWHVCVKRGVYMLCNPSRFSCALQAGSN